jgi:hypothetical protein
MEERSHSMAPEEAEGLELLITGFIFKEGL